MVFTAPYPMYSVEMMTYCQNRYKSVRVFVVGENFERPDIEKAILKYFRDSKPELTVTNFCWGDSFTTTQPMTRSDDPLYIMDIEGNPVAYSGPY